MKRNKERLLWDLFIGQIKWKDDIDAYKLSHHKILTNINNKWMDNNIKWYNT